MSRVCLFCQSTNRDSVVFCMTCGRPLAPTLGSAFDPSAGRLLPGILLDGRYRVERVLGGGGMGAVYLAADRRLGDIACAVKEWYGQLVAAWHESPGLERGYELDQCVRSGYQSR